MKEKLGFGFLGNGVTVWDSNVTTEQNDYKKVAHIDYQREVRYYCDLSREAMVRIGNFARYGNMTPAAQPERYALKPFAGSGHLTAEDKDNFLRDCECSAAGVGPFIEKEWSDEKMPYENLALFHEWWRIYGKYAYLDADDGLMITETDGEAVDIFLSPEKTPAAYERKVRCLMSGGLTLEQAKEDVLNTPIPVELFYDVGVGLFAVESEAVDSCDIYNPFSGREIPKIEDDE